MAEGVSCWGWRQQGEGDPALRGKKCLESDVWGQDEVVESRYPGVGGLGSCG